jgi:hypothetical protein
VEARTQRNRNLDTQYNGIVYGQYTAPIEEFIFPEPRAGAPFLVDNDYRPMLFLTQGGLESNYGYINGPLNPWPGLSPAPALCLTNIFPAATNNILAATPALDAGGTAVPLRTGLTNFIMAGFQWTSSLPTAIWTCQQSSNPMIRLPTTAPSTVAVSLTADRVCASALTSRTFNSPSTAPNPTTAAMITAASWDIDKFILTVTLATNVIGTGNFFSLLPFPVSVNIPGSCFDPNPLMTGSEESFVQSGNWPVNTRTITLFTPRPVSTITVVRTTGGYWASGTTTPTTFVSMQTVIVNLVD